MKSSIHSPTNTYKIRKEFSFKKLSGHQVPVRDFELFEIYIYTFEKTVHSKNQDVKWTNTYEQV